MAGTDYRSELLANLGRMGASVQEVQDRLREMEVDQAGNYGALKTTVEAQASHLNDLELRVRGLEAIRSQAVALSAVAALLVSALVKWGVR